MGDPVRFEPVLVKAGEWLLWGDIYCGAKSDLDKKMGAGYDRLKEYNGHVKSGWRFGKDVGDRREQIGSDGWPNGFWVLRAVFGWEDNEWGEVSP